MAEPATAESSRSLRARKAVDYAALDSADGEGSIFGASRDASRFERLLAEKVPALGAAGGNIDVIPSTQFTREWVQGHGLRRPVLIQGREGLGLKVPAAGFTVRDVATVVGESHPIDVIDVAAQEELPGGWTLGDWADYYHTPPARRRRVLNVISLEFSGTRLAGLVRSPRAVRQLDWIDNVWPGARRAAGEYPQVQYYCLMSVAGSLTDFHVDFGGTSVWYHGEGRAGGQAGWWQRWRVWRILDIPP